MFTIWKTNLELTTTQDIEVPEGATMLCAREQGDNICVWYRCNTEAPKIKRRIYIIGTGHNAEITKGAVYLGTATMMGGALIFHVFEGFI